MPALIIAFDGVLADTLPLRAHALTDAAAAEFSPRAPEHAAAVIAGRTMLEASLALFPHEAATDPTLPELVALRAQRGFRHLVQHGVALRAGVVQDLREAAAAGTRVIVRADSERRDVEPLLAMAGLEHLVNLLRCSDDAPRTHGASLRRSWLVIAERLGGMSLPMTDCRVIEATEESAQVAREFVPQVQVYR